MNNSDLKRMKDKREVLGEQLKKALNDLGEGVKQIDPSMDGTFKCPNCSERENAENIREKLEIDSTKRSQLEEANLRGKRDPIDDELDLAASRLQNIVPILSKVDPTEDIRGLKSIMRYLNETREEKILLEKEINRVEEGIVRLKREENQVDKEISILDQKIGDEREIVEEKLRNIDDVKERIKNIDNPQDGQDKIKKLLEQRQELINSLPVGFY